MNIPSLMPPDQSPVRSAADLEQLWRALVGELGFARPQLYVLFLEGAMPLFVAHLEELPARPSPTDLRQVVLTFRQVTEAACAFLLCRPGTSATLPVDRTWARALASVTPWPVHVASDEDIRVVAPDDLADAG